MPENIILFDTLSSEGASNGEKFAGVPDGEKEWARLAAVRRYALLDTAPEEPFDRLTRLAALLFEVEVAGLTVVGPDRVFFKSSHGLDERALPRALTYCTHAIETDDGLFVEDAAAEERFKAASRHVAANGYRFYAGVPLRTADGLALGTFCVLGEAPRAFAAEDRAALRDFARQAMNEIEVRRLLPEGARALFEDRALFAAVLDVQREIARATLTTEEAIRRLLHHAQSLTGADGAGAAEIEGGELVYREAVGSVVEHKGMRLDLDGSFSGHCVRRNAVLHCTDTEEDERVDREAARVVNVRSIIGVPLRAHGELVGVINVLAEEPEAFTPEAVQALTFLADLMGKTVERTQARQELRENERRHRALVDQTAEAICFIDPEEDLRVVEANPAFWDLLGYDETEALSVYDYVVGSRESIDDNTQRALSGAPVVVDRQWQCEDGTPVEVQLTLSAIEQQGKRLLFVVGRDVTEQKRTQAALHREERKHRTLIERANVAILIFTPEDETILGANPEACRMYGLAREELIGISLQDLTVHVERGRQEVHRILERGGTANFETEHVRKDGTHLYVLASCSKVEYDGREVILYFGRDVTERRGAEEQFRRGEARLRAVTENAGDAITIVDEEGIIQYASGAMEEVIGVASEQAVATSGFDYVHPDDVATVKAGLAESLRRPGEVVEVEFRRNDATDTFHHLSVHGRNLMSQPGIDGILCIIRDVTEKKKFEKELIEAKEEAEEMARLKSAFLANMSHEIRTPLTSVLGFAEILADEVEGEHREFVELIQRGGRRLSATLNSVLDLARLEAGGVELAMEAVSLNDVVHEIVSFFQGRAEEKGLALRVELPEATVLACADETAVGRVLNNLLSNAVKFTEEGRVGVRVAAENGEARLKVTDTGIGMDEGFLEDLFKEFRQESTGLTRSHEGTGLGMAITWRLVELMGGEIHVESERGRGTTFTVTLPRAEDAAA